MKPPCSDPVPNLHALGHLSSLVRARWKLCFLFEWYFWKWPLPSPCTCRISVPAIKNHGGWEMACLNSQPEIMGPKILEFPMVQEEGEHTSRTVKPNPCTHQLKLSEDCPPFLYRQCQGDVWPVLKLAQVPTNSMHLWSSVNVVQTTPHPPSSDRQTAGILLSPPLSPSCMRSVEWRNGSVWSSYGKGFQTEVVGSSPISIDVVAHDFYRIRTVLPSLQVPQLQGKTVLGTALLCLLSRVLSDCNVRGSSQARDLLRRGLPRALSTVLRVRRGPSPTGHLMCSSSRPPLFYFLSLPWFFATQLPHAKSDQHLLLLLLPVPLCFSWTRKKPRRRNQHHQPFFPPPNPRQTRQRET
jgi:hypothetical protein